MPSLYTGTGTRCPEKTSDGRQCQLADGHRAQRAGGCRYDDIPGKTCTCMLRWYPNRCTAHPEQNQ